MSERSLRHALRTAAGDFASLVANRQAQGVAVPGQDPRSAHHSIRRRRHLPGGTEAERAVQTRYAAFLETRVCLPPARVRHRSAHDPASDGSSIAVHDLALPAHRHLEGLLDQESAGSAASPVATAATDSGTRALLSTPVRGAAFLGGCAWIAPLR